MGRSLEPEMGHGQSEMLWMAPFEGALVSIVSMKCLEN